MALDVDPNNVLPVTFTLFALLSLGMKALKIWTHQLCGGTHRQHGIKACMLASSSQCLDILNKIGLSF